MFKLCVVTTHITITQENKPTNERTNEQTVAYRIYLSTSSTLNIIVSLNQW